MKYVKFFGSAGYCGTDYEHYVAFSDDFSEENIYEWSNAYAEENAESYSYIIEENEEDVDFYWENAYENCGWYEVTEAEWAENDGEEAFV